MVVAPEWELISSTVDCYLDNNRSVAKVTGTIQPPGGSWVHIAHPATTINRMEPSGQQKLSLSIQEKNKVISPAPSEEHSQCCSAINTFIRYAMSPEPL